MTADLDGNALALMLRPFAGPVAIDGLTQLPGGASKEKWSL
jgi:hypothetical protein